MKPRRIVGFLSSHYVGDAGFRQRRFCKTQGEGVLRFQNCNEFQRSHPQFLRRLSGSAHSL